MKTPKVHRPEYLYTRLNRVVIMKKQLNCMGRRKEDKSYFNRVCLYRFLLALTPVSGDQNVSFLLEQVGYILPGSFISCFEEEREKSVSVFLVPPVFQVFLAQSNTKWHILG